MYKLTKEQKESNLREQLEILYKKKNNIEKQIQGIERKLSKPERVNQEILPQEEDLRRPRRIIPNEFR